MKKKEFIEFLVEECYSNFPELVDKFSKENMYKILNNNIKDIRTSDNPHAIYDGTYSTETGIIEIYGINDISLDALKKNIKGVKNTVVHESIHALFKNGVHNTGCNLVRRGISIKGFVQDHINYFKSRKTVLEKIKVLTDIPRNGTTLYEQGRGLNEGFTEWCTIQCANSSSAYFNEVGIIMQLQQFRDEKEILKIGDGNYKQIANLFNMDYYEFDIFSRQIDEMLFNEYKIKENRKIQILKEKKDKGEVIDISLFDENEIAELTEQGVIKNEKIQLEQIDEVYKKNIEPFKNSHKVVATEIQRKLLEKVILPGIKNWDSNERNSKRLLMTHSVVKRCLESCNIEKDDIPEFKELEEIYKMNINDDKQKIMSKSATKESFFKSLVNKLVTHKQITLEEVNDCELANEKKLENNKGDKSIGEY